MIELFYRLLECILKPYPNTANWITALLMALLGIQTTVKQDLNCTPSELVYSTTLQIPGRFVATTTELSTDQSSYVTKLKMVMQQLKVILLRQQKHQNINVIDLL